MFYTRFDVAKILQKSPQSVWSLINRGRIKAELSERNWRISAQAIKDYCALRCAELEEESRLLKTISKSITIDNGNR